MRCLFTPDGNFVKSVVESCCNRATLPCSCVGNVMVSPPFLCFNPLVNMRIAIGSVSLGVSSFKLPAGDFLSGVEGGVSLVRTASTGDVALGFFD